MKYDLGVSADVTVFPATRCPPVVTQKSVLSRISVDFEHRDNDCNLSSGTA